MIIVSLSLSIDGCLGRMSEMIENIALSVKLPPRCHAVRLLIVKIPNAMRHTNHKAGVGKDIYCPPASLGHGP